MLGIPNYSSYKKSILKYTKESCCEFDEATAVRVILHIYSTCEKSNMYDFDVITTAVVLAYDDSLNMAIPDNVDPDKLVYRRATEYLHTQTRSDTFISRNATP